MLAAAAMLLPGPAFAATPDRLIEQCRMIAPTATPLPRALQALDGCADPAAPWAAGTIWLNYRNLPPLLTGKTYRLTLDNHPGAGTDLWLIGRDGSAKHYSYDPKAADRAWAAGNYASIFITPQGPLDRIVVRLRDAEGHHFVRAPRIARAGVFGVVERDQAALYGIAVGMLALTILFHLSLFVAMRKRFQLVYCFHVGLLVVYGLCYSGIVHILLPGVTDTAISRALSFTMIAATATGVAFIVEFLGSGTPRWLRRWAMASCFASTVSALALMVATGWWSYPIYLVTNFVALHAILLTAILLGTACIRRQPLALPLTLGWIPPILVSLMYPARTFGLIGDAMLPDGLMMLATTIECLILSLPVAARIRDLRLEHERAHERHSVLERQAQTDSLTGLSNRRGFGDALTRAAAASAEATPLAVLVIDIDHFKRVNDRYGHAAGDTILKLVAAHVARVAGKGAIVARYGGEEFVVALRGHDLPRAGTIAERIRNSVGTAFRPGAELPQVTISIGVAAGLTDEIDSLLADADCALYRAKNEGRDRVMLSDGPLMYAAAA